MILKGSQRGGAKALAMHLLNADDNEHVEVESISGFMANNVEDAFQEIYAASLATSCKQFLFSLSLSPPENAVVSNQDFRDAIDQAMSRLGLTGQPHVIIFHEKHGRRHAHLVVSRIDGEKMRAINLSFFKERLCDLSRELFLTHNWELPKGHVDRALSNPLNYSLEEHQVAKRVKRDPQVLKKILIDCWEQSDSKAGFSAALNEAGFRLYRGNRRGFVAVDREGQIYSLSRWLGVKSKELRLRLGDPAGYPSVDDAIEDFETCGDRRSDIIVDESELEIDPRIADLEKRLTEIEGKKTHLIAEHRIERRKLQQAHQEQTADLIKEFQRSQSTLRDFWNWVSGKKQAIIAKRQKILDELSQSHKLKALALSNTQRIALRHMRSEIAVLAKKRDALSPSKKPSVNPQQFIKVVDPDALLHAQQIRKSPDYVLRLITDKQANFSRNDILRTLARYIDDPLELQKLSAQTLCSSELLVVRGNKSNPLFTTRSYQKLEQELFVTAKSMADCKAYGVQPKHMQTAIQRQNKDLQKTAGANLSNAQCIAIEHVLNRRQLCAIIGLAGAGKSTLLSAANHAWNNQGYRVLGAALSGQAADGLQQASDIPSWTLASWEYSWKNERHQLQAGDVFVIDEAGMVGSAQLARITKHVHEQGAKLVLVGDPDQLQPINAGTPFRQIADDIGFAELSEIRRQQSDWQIQASIDLARGNTEKAIKAYDDHGGIEFAQTRSDAITALVEDYMVDYEFNGDSKSRIALAHRRADVFAINQAIRSAKKTAGELIDEQVYKTANGPRAFAKGDRFLFTRNDAELGVRNGMLGTVEKTSNSEITVRIDGDGGDRSTRRVTFNPDHYESYDHGYATTIHKSQGATVDNAYVLASSTFDKNLTYVAMTRHRHEPRLYAAIEEFTDIEKLTIRLGKMPEYKAKKAIEWESPKQSGLNQYYRNIRSDIESISEVDLKLEY